MIDSPTLLFAICLVTLGLSAQIGAYLSRLSRRKGRLEEDERSDLGVILTAVLTLLGLIIGFTFSMAIGRYNQRKDDEATEANVISTEFTPAGLLPEPDAARVRRLLNSYLTQRLLFYRTRDVGQLQQINGSTAQLQTDLWSAVQDIASIRPTPIMALVLSGMNEVLNSQGYTLAAWRNGIARLSVESSGPRVTHFTTPSFV